MTDRSVTSQVEVPVDPGTAFVAFTEELDLWWVRGPINFFAGGRARAMRCEPGVGGRLLEVYDDDIADALELARITAWEPGRRLAWKSSVDDVETEVSFDGAGQSTTVRVVARIPAGGQVRGGTVWTRVVPRWFGPWCRAREGAPREVRDIARLALGISYARPAEAARWLADVFGFTSPDPLPDATDPGAADGHEHAWIEFRLGNGSLMIFGQEDPPSGACGIHMPWVYVDDIGEHFARAQAGGATIVQKPHSPWGLPMYIATDPDGNQWTFAQARPTM